MKKLTILLTLTALSFLGLGCKSPAQQAAENLVNQASGGKIQLNTQGDKSFTVTTDQGTITSEQKIPDAFPKYIPIYQNAKLATASTVNENSIYISFESPDSLSTIYEWYKNAMKDWKLTSEANYGPAGLLTFEKNSEKLNISFTYDAGTSVFNSAGQKVTSGQKTTFILNWSK